MDTPELLLDPNRVREAMSKPTRLVGHSTRSLADQVGMSHSKIHGLMTGKRPRLAEDEADQIATALHVQIVDLLPPSTLTNMCVSDQKGEADDPGTTHCASSIGVGKELEIDV
ncbi:helix-turn-helix transcriptional regulator [Streptomyces sp. SID3343]|uniref:helix-turn-helix domain-containing protein n=1 Tax=Streptomyces sp. SID3343 TaxID=2690260 RepID=UPI0013680582|nr:helix-turn-helix transcriptional regulator [Streptomyces sp. SID3343]MYW03496.1 helix-turn-helix domain-containing protein [Streptomyces sp. SID3343]